MEKMNSVKISGISEISEGSFVLGFERDFEFLPGQVIGINIGVAQPARLYSIASGNKEKEVRILFNIKDDGYLTPLLASSKPGDSILVSHPFGKFVCNESNAYWIASGTGIAPFASMIFSGMSDGKTLIHGSRFLSGFYFQEEISPLLKTAYIRCCSAEAGEGIYPGRLTKYLEELKNLPADKKYYLCGSAEMVVETRDILINKGIPYENIIAEIYF
jgi:ferredoxin/flavodoxin---NADP+ reductase